MSTPEGGWLIAGLRALSDASLLSMLGAVVFHMAIAPAGLRIARWSAAVACVALAAWIVAQAANLAGSIAATPAILSITEFGHLAAASLGCALLVLLVAGPGWRGWVALSAAIAAVVVQAGHSHGAAMEPGLGLLRVSTTLHMLAAGIWLGGLMPLGRLAAVASLPALVRAVRRYSVLGLCCVLVLLGTAAMQGWVLVGGVAGWVGTDYGRVACGKVALFATLIGLALVNRQMLSPALTGASPDRARKRLVGSIALETVVGLLILGLAAVLSSIEPAMHQQPLWPFNARPSLVAIDEDPDLRREVLLACAALGGAGLLVVAALVVRRFRVAAGAFAALVAGFAVPHLDLLFVPAYPTSFFRSPTAFAATSIVRGSMLFPSHCAACHGAGGEGGGPLAASLPVPAADLTAAHLWMHSDGELFWWLTHGIEAPEGGMAMPGFAGALSDDDRWALIDDIRAHNAGLVHAETGDWTPPLPAPELQAACPDGRALTLADLRGQTVRLIFPGSQPAPALQGAVTLTVGGPATTCNTADPAVPAAYAIVLGVPPSDLPGTTILIDANGWLRSVHANQLDPAQQLALARQVETHPLAASAAGAHHHAE